MEATISIKLTAQEAEDILASFISRARGVDYWANAYGVRRIDGVLVAHICDNYGGSTFDTQFIHAGVVQTGVDRLCTSEYHWHVIDLLNGTGGAGAADVIMQMAIFGKVMFD